MRALFLIFITLSLYAGENFTPELKQIKLKGDIVHVSKSCVSCLAQKEYLKLKKSDVEKIRDVVFGGRTWGDQVCLKIFKARIVSSFDKDKNESHYCLFKDNSYISTDELNYLSQDLIK
jgi:hypothetical protein